MVDRGWRFGWIIFVYYYYSREGDHRLGYHTNEGRKLLLSS
jgi:hypothetical protein